MRRHTEERGSRAAELFLESNTAQQQVVDKPGFPARQCLERRLSADGRYRDQNFKRGLCPVDLKPDVVRRAMSGEEPMRRPRRDILDNPELLRHRCEELELVSAVAKEMPSVLKVGPRASAGDLTIGERVRAVDALRGAFGLRRSREDGPFPEHLLPRRGHDALSRQVRRAAPRHRAALRQRPPQARVPRDPAGPEAVRRDRLGEGGPQDHGRGGPGRAVRQEEDAMQLLRRRDNGGLPNILAREFRAPAPNTRWVADITEMRAADGRAYLNPAIDLLDGMIAAWGASRSPNALLANAMPERATSVLPEGARPIIHADQGVHYRRGGGSASWTGTAWRGRCCRGRRAARTTPPRGSSGGSRSRCATGPAGRGGWRPSWRQR